MLYQSQAEINAFYVSVITRVASSQKVGIQDWGFKSTIELLEEISIVSPQVSSELGNFLRAYQAWYDVHVGIDKAGTAGNLTGQQAALLNSAIMRRDATRKNLLVALQ